MEELRRELEDAVRSLGRSPGFTARPWRSPSPSGWMPVAAALPALRAE